MAHGGQGRDASCTHPWDVEAAGRLMARWPKEEAEVCWLRHAQVAESAESGGKGKRGVRRQQYRHRSLSTGVTRKSQIVWQCFQAESMLLQR